MDIYTHRDEKRWKNVSRHPQSQHRTFLFNTAFVNVYFTVEKFMYRVLIAGGIFLSYGCLSHNDCDSQNVASLTTLEITSFSVWATSHFIVCCFYPEPRIQDTLLGVHYNKSLVQMVFIHIRISFRKTK